MKKQEFTQLIGKKITSISDWTSGDDSLVITTDSGVFNLNIDDEGGYGNDSHAYLHDISGLQYILGQEITGVEERSDSWGAEIRLQTDKGVCVIDIRHEHNGYYGFSYDLTIQNN